MKDKENVMRVMIVIRSGDVLKNFRLEKVINLILEFKMTRSKEGSLEVQ